MRTVGRGMEGRSLHARKVGTLWTRFRARPLPESPDYSHGSGAAARRDHASRSSHMWSVQGPHSDHCPPPARPQRAQHEFAQEQRTERACARPASPHPLGGTGCHPQQASPLPPARDKAGQEAGGRPQPSPNPWPPWEAAPVSTGSAGPGSPWFPGLGSPGSSLWGRGAPDREGWAHGEQGRMPCPARPRPPPPILPGQLQASGAPFPSAGQAPHTSSLSGAQHPWYGPSQPPGSTHHCNYHLASTER